MAGFFRFGVSMQVNIQSALQAALILGTLAFGYGALDNRVEDNTKDIARIELESKQKNEEFMKKFDSFISEQRALNRQIVQNTTNQGHILKKLDLN